MKHTIRWFLVAFCTAYCALAAPVAEALSVTPEPVDLPDSPIMIVGYQNTVNTPGFVQLYNNSSSIVSMHGWKLEYSTATVTMPIELRGWMLPHELGVVSQDDFASNSDSVFTLPTDIPHDVMTSLRLIPPSGFVPYTVSGVLTTSNRYELSKSDAGNYTKSSKFEVVLEGAVLHGGGLYNYPEDSPLRIVEILANPRDCGPLENTADCYEFVKLYNPTDQIVDMSQYRLRLGYVNQTSGIANTVLLHDGIGARSYYAVAMRSDGRPLEITASGGNVWLEDAKGLTVYDETVVSYKDIGESDHKGQSWALSGNGWQWAVASPNSANNFAIPKIESTATTSTLKPCRSDQYRSTETNRCRTISTTTQKACRADQYRSPETNRCRNLASAASTLKPCAIDQVRSSETNRCRKVGTAANQLTPCKESQERNPETNRCRNVVGAVPSAAFGVEEVADTGKAFMGWWALGGIGLLAVGYGVWEWRYEIRSAITKVIAYFPGKK